MPNNRALTDYATMAPTPLQARFAEWIPDQTGYDPASARTKTEAFAEGVRLATALRIPFQASPENRAARAASANGGVKAPEAKPAKAAKRAPVAAAAPEEQAPVKPARKVAKSAAPAQVAKTTRRPRAAAETRSGSEAPF